MTGKPNVSAGKSPSSAGHKLRIAKETAIMKTIVVIVMLTVLVPPIFVRVVGDDFVQGWEIVAVFAAITFLVYLAATMTLGRGSLAKWFARQAALMQRISKSLAVQEGAESTGKQAGEGGAQ